MPAERVTMRKINDILRLNETCQLSHRQIAKSCGVARSTVAEILRRATTAGLSWPLPADVDDATLEARLYPETPPITGTSRPVPAWATVHQELRRKGVTLALLGRNIRPRISDGYQYSRFCDRYGVWLKTLDRCLRQEHRAGEKLFVDYAGQTMPVRTRPTGALREAPIFVAVLGASNYTYAEATWTQALPDWTASHVRAFAFFGGVPQIVVPDNLKSGVTKTCRYGAGAQPDVSGAGPALWCGRHSRLSPETTRQGQGRGRRPNRRAVDSGLPAPSVLLQSHRPQCRDRHVPDTTERPPLQETPRLPSLGLRHRGPARTAAAARRALCLRRVAAGPRQH